MGTPRILPPVAQRRGTETRTTVRTVPLVRRRAQRGGRSSSASAPMGSSHNMVRADGGARLIYVSERGSWSRRDIPALLERRDRSLAGRDRAAGGAVICPAGHHVWYTAHAAVGRHDEKALTPPVSNCSHSRFCFSTIFFRICVVLYL